MNIQILAVTIVSAAALISGCSGGGTDMSAMNTQGQSAQVSGKVADGYLVDAEVFLDINGNYQRDASEPWAITDSSGSYMLNVAAVDIGKYPIIALAIKDQTIDKDTNQAVANSYLLSMPASAVSGTVNSNFISPVSTLIREKMAVNSGMSMPDAMTQLRNQMNLPSGMNLMADYVAGSKSGSNAAQYQTMHATAQQMVGLMAEQANLVMNGSAANQNRYRGMMATINSNMSGVAANVINGSGMNSAFMADMRSRMQSQLGAIPVGGAFGNYSGMFRNMTSHGRFWSGTGAPMTPMSGGMMR
jgi:hypothetical protein